MAYNRNQKHKNQNSYQQGQGGKRKKQFRK